MRKIIVIGCPGGGKSTFAKELHRITGIPLYHLDLMYWNSDRSKVEKPLFLRRLEDAMAGEEWIIDGNYASTIELRLAACDTVFFLDYPLEVCLDGIRERRGKSRSDMPWVEQEGECDEEFIRFIENYRTESRPVVLELLKRYPEKQQVLFGDRGEAERFLRRLEEVSEAPASTLYAAIVQIPDWPDAIRLILRAETPEDARAQAIERLRPDCGDEIDRAEIRILPLRDAIR